MTPCIVTKLVIKGGMQEKPTAKSIIAKWPTKRALASDISRITGQELKPIAVTRWASRKSIPSKYDYAITTAAVERGLSVSLVDLMLARATHVDQVGNVQPPVQGGVTQ